MHPRDGIGSSGRFLEVGDQDAELFPNVLEGVPASLDLEANPRIASICGYPCAQHVDLGSLRCTFKQKRSDHGPLPCAPRSRARS